MEQFAVLLKKDPGLGNYDSFLKFPKTDYRDHLFSIISQKISS